jgi:hypothetical protein
MQPVAARVEFNPRAPVVQCDEAVAEPRPPAHTRPEAGTAVVEDDKGMHRSSPEILVGVSLALQRQPQGYFFLTFVENEISHVQAWLTPWTRTSAGRF